jgi:hypothetical protein
VRVRAESSRRGIASPKLRSCTIADSLVDTAAYVCLRVPAPRAPCSISPKPFHYAPPVPHPHTHACTSLSCSTTFPGAGPLHAPPVCRSRRQFASACARVPTPAACSAHTRRSRVSVRVLLLLLPLQPYRPCACCRAASAPPLCSPAAARARLLPRASHLRAHRPAPRAARPAWAGLCLPKPLAHLQLPRYSRATARSVRAASPRAALAQSRAARCHALAQAPPHLDPASRVFAHPHSGRAAAAPTPSAWAACPCAPPAWAARRSGWPRSARLHAVGQAARHRQGPASTPERPCCARCFRHPPPSRARVLPRPMPPALAAMLLSACAGGRESKGNGIRIGGAEKGVAGGGERQGAREDEKIRQKRERTEEKGKTDFPRTYTRF